MSKDINHNGHVNANGGAVIIPFPRAFRPPMDEVERLKRVFMAAPTRENYDLFIAAVKRRLVVGHDG